MLLSAAPNLRLGWLGLLGGALLAAGVAVASRTLPEWRGGELPAEAQLRSRYNELVKDAGLSATGEQPRVVVRSRDHELAVSYRAFPTTAAAWLSEARRGLVMEVQGRARWRDDPEGDLVIGFALDASPWYCEWSVSDLGTFLLTSGADLDLDGLREALASMLVRPGEQRGPDHLKRAGGNDVRLQALAGFEPPTHLASFSPPAAAVRVMRRLGTVDQGIGELEELGFRQIAVRLLRPSLTLLAAIGLFLWLALQRRVDVHAAALLSALMLLSSLGSGALHGSGGAAAFVERFLEIGYTTLLLLLLWSCAESWLRSTATGFTTTLDSLKLGRLGPLAGRELVAGSAVGAALAGLGLLTIAGLLVSGRGWPTASTLRWPLFALPQNPLAAGALAAGFSLLALAVALHLVSPRRAPWLAVLLAAPFAAPCSLTPYGFELALGGLASGILLWSYRRFGMTACLVAGVQAATLPRAVFSLLHGGRLWEATLVPAGLIVLGLIGMSRRAAVDEAQAGVPGFVRRLETQRRVRYEMGLLARMQLGLLPATLPHLPGWELTARSILASEVGGDLYDFLRDEQGRLWLAAGDVSGHGYSCAISQAMTKASLTSLIDGDRTPGQILGRIDRVLRGGQPVRGFTTLCLLRLDPSTGEGMLANAGHPFPLVVADGKVEEIEMPGFPLGQGPTRRYADHSIQLQPGAVLTIFSDGLVETADRQGEPYGFDRPGLVLARAARWRASEILEMLLVDWRHHVGGGAPPDDTTVVVLKRHADTPKNLDLRHDD